MDEITAEDFDAFVTVQMSGETNMLAIGAVSALSGLSEEKVELIIKNYDELAQKFGT